MKLTAKEEILVELFRTLHPEQQGHLVTTTRALVDANRITEATMKAPIAIMSDARIEAKYGLPKPSSKKFKPRPRLGGPKPRRPDRNQDDNS